MAKITDPLREQQENKFVRTAEGKGGKKIKLLLPQTPEAFEETEAQREIEDRAREEFERSRTRSLEAETRRTELLDQLSARARGEGPSLAEAQLRSASERSLSQQVGAAAAQRGGSPAAIQRQLARSQAGAGQQLASQAATTKIQETQAAQQQLAQQLSQEQALADQLTNNFLRLGLSVDQARQAAAIRLEELQSQERIAREQGAATRSAAASQASSGLLGSLIGGAATIGGVLIAGPAALLSDKNQKINIDSGNKQTQQFLNALNAKSFEYKDSKIPGAAEGERFGVLAQDLEKSKMGKSLVKETDHGKMIDIAQGFGAVLAAQAQLNERLKDIESKKKKKRKK